MKHLEFIQQHGDTAVEEPMGLYSGHFTVDNADPFVYLEYDYGIGVNPDYVYKLSNASAKNTIQSFDTFLLISVGFILPPPFELFQPGCALSLVFSDTELDPVGLDGFGDETGKIAIPFANYEIPIGLVYSPKKLIDSSMSIGGKLLSYDGTALQISMTDIPDSLNTKVFEVPIFAKILHNAPLI